MFNIIRSFSFPCLLFLSLILTGCFGAPTRHLVSDVSMVTAGQSSREDVIALMGDPDSKRMVSPDIEEWVYYEEDRTLLQDTPLVGGIFNADGYSMVVITFSGDTVATCNYRGYLDDEFDWQDDYSWQETEKK